MSINEDQKILLFSVFLSLNQDFEYRLVLNIAASGCDYASQ